MLGNLIDKNPISKWRRACRSLLTVASAISLTGLYLPAQAQGGDAASPQAAPPAGGNVPIDIQANEQEFAGDHVNAKGNVKVVYKESIILAPLATLFKDAQGQPQTAVFTGHSRLTQGTNKIDADKLTFEIATQKIIADGAAHSEVISGDTEEETKKKEEAAAEAKKKEEATAQAAKAKSALANAAKTAKGGKSKTENGGWQTDSNSKEPASTGVANEDLGPGNAPPPADAGMDKPRNKPPEKIITDSDHQEFEQESGHFEATGHVRVHHGDIFVTADRLQLVYGDDKKPETALFNGNVEATQNKNKTAADSMTYFLPTQRLQATGNVRSKVIQEKPSGPKKNNAADTAKPKSSGRGGRKKSDPPTIGFNQEGSDEPIYIISDAQDYNKENGRLAADGNVRVYHGETLGKGQRAILVRDQEGHADRIVFEGRSQITQPGKRWIGDHILFFIDANRVLAEGNTRAIILKKPSGSEETSEPAKVTAPASEPDESADKLASKSDESTSKLADQSGESADKRSGQPDERPSKLAGKSDESETVR